MGTTRNLVAVLDTGVEASHAEFAKSDGSSKVSGKNFDFGPCRNGDTSNCWLREDAQDDDSGKSYYIYYLLDANGEKIYQMSKTTTDSWNKTWNDKYTDDYDRDEYADDPSPNNGVNADQVSDSSFTHGTHVAGIIGANWDRSENGMMGVAFSNTDIYAMRYDMISPLYLPIEAALAKNVLALNMSLGWGTRIHSAANVKEYFLATDDETRVQTYQYIRAVTEVIDSYSVQTDELTGKEVTDGMIWVIAAGNKTQ